MSTPRDEALEFLKTQEAGVLATLSEEGSPRARTVYYAADDAFNIYFFTLVGTRKVEEAARDARAAFVVFSSATPRTVQIEGTLEDLTETATMDEHVRTLSDRMLSRGLFSTPVTHLDPGKITYYKLSPTWVRWGDFTKGEGTAAVLTEIPL